MNAEFKKGPWRVLASAALGTALAGSALMGAAVPAQAAAAVPPGTMTVAPGGTAGSGVISTVADTAFRQHFVNGITPDPAPQTFLQGYSVSIGGNQSVIDTDAGVFDHEEYSDALIAWGYTTTRTLTRIDIPYS